MLSFFVIILTVLLLIDCLFLGLLVLVQLPKKEAGVGMAFGGGAADALFGAGSGTALSNLTKYTATAFFILVFSLSIAKTHEHNGNVSALKSYMEKQSALPIPSPASAPAPTAVPPASGSQAFPITVGTNNVPATTSAPATAAPSNAPAPK